MVDFSTKATDIDSQIQPDVRVQQPVDRSGEIDALNNIGRGIGLGARTVATYFQNQSNSKKAGRLAKFDIGLAGLQDGEDQGISPQEIRTRGRAALTAAIANDPNAEEEYLKRYSTWLNQSGYDKVATPAMQQYEINQATVSKLVSEGWLSADKANDSSAVEAAKGNLDNYQQTVRGLETDQKKIGLESSKLELTSKQRGELKAQGEESALSGLGKVADASVPYWRNQFDTIVAAAKGANDPSERQKIVQDGITQMKNDLLTKKAQLSGSSLNLDQAKIDQVFKPVEQLVDLYSQQLDGTIDTESFDRQSKALQAKSKLLTLQGLGEQGRQWAALSDISKNAADVLAPALTNKVVEMFTKNQANPSSQNDPNGSGSPDERGSTNKPADLLPTGDEEVKTTKSYLDSITELLKRSNGGRFDEPTKKEIDNQMNGILRGVDVFGNSVTSAKEFQPLIDFFSSPLVGQYLSQGGKVPPAVLGATNQVVRDGYQKQVIPLLQNELGTEQFQLRVGNKKGPVTDFYEPTMETGRFGFKLKEGVEVNLSSSTQLRQLNNSSFTKVMNKMIMTNAHLQGNTDYQKSYDEIAPAVFEALPKGTDERSSLKTPSGEPVQVASLKTDIIGEVLNSKNDFSLEDLVTKPAPQDITPGLQKAASGGFTGDASNFIGKTDPIAIARSFDGVDEKKDAKIIGAFIKQASGININPATTAWCAAFVNGVLGASGTEGTGRLNARSFLNWGQPTENPQQGDVVVFSRGKAGSGKGHVGFYVGTEERNGEQYIRVLSGNQSDSVNESSYPASRLLGYRRANG